VDASLLPRGAADDPPTALHRALSGEGLTVTRTRTRAYGQVEATVAFEAVSALCDAPLLRRECSYRRTGNGGFDLAMAIPPRRSNGPRTGQDAEIRVRTEGRITTHNSDGPLQRGNVLSWVRPLDRFLGEGLDVRVRTDGTSVFAATTRIVLRSALIALGIVGIGLTLLLLEGRRRLRRQRGSPPAP
jgi:hypothetical protein